jgi:hypothetical protein
MGCESSRRIPPKEARKEEGSFVPPVEEQNVRAMASHEPQESRKVRNQLTRPEQIPQENESDVVNSEDDFGYKVNVNVSDLRIGI